MTSGDEVAALREDIARTRTELGETVEALAAKADVKARAHEKVEETKARLVSAAADAKDRVRESSRELAHELRTEPAVPARRAVYRVRTSVREHPKQWVAAGAALVAFVLLVARRRTRTRTRHWRDAA